MPKSTKQPSYQPLYDRIIVKRDSLEEKRSESSLIVMPTHIQDKPSKGMVLMVGAGHMQADGKQLPLTVKKGDHVIFGKLAGVELELEGEQVVILRESEVILLCRA